MNEAQWSIDVYALADLYGWRRYHTYRSKRSPSGYPDETLVGRGRVVFAELKTDARDSQPSAAQLAWLADLDRNGAEVYLWRPQHLQLIQQVLAARGHPGSPDWTSAQLNSRAQLLDHLRAHYPKG